MIRAGEKFHALFRERPDFEASTTAVSNFFRRPWFSRTWTFQEVVLSRTATFHCGEYAIGLAAVYASYATVKSCKLETTLYPEIFHPGVVARILALEDNIKNLSGLLILTQDLKSTDPRDKIFGLLGLTKTSEKSLLLPRYDISVSDVYTSYTLALIKDDNELWVLMATDRESPSSDLPSWVPDWKQLSRTRTPENPHGTTYNVSPYITPRFQDLETRPSPELALEGAQVDLITDTYSVEDLCDELFEWNGWDFGILIASFVQNLALPNIYA